MKLNNNFISIPYVDRCALLFFFCFFFRDAYCWPRKSLINKPALGSGTHSRHVNELKQIIHTGPSNML